MTPASDSGSFILISQFSIEDCKLKIEGPAEDIAGIQEISYNVHYELGELRARSIMGDIQYDLEGTGLNIDPIDLTDLPDFLDDPETNLSIANPQIYLNLFNPVGSFGLGYQSGLEIMAVRPSGSSGFESPMIKVPAEAGTFNFMLAPNPEGVTNVPDEYKSGLQRLVYNNLGEILAGNGLPKQLDIDLVKPEIPQQTLKSPFTLGTDLEGMRGEYMFLAPLALKDGSKIVKVVDGWWSEDLSDLNIDLLSICADATNGLTTGVILNVFAIDRDGNQISTTGSIKLDENAMSSPIELKLEGIDGKPFNNLDGIKLYVIAANNTDEPLAPSQSITLENLKAKVTGNYTRKL